TEVGMRCSAPSSCRASASASPCGCGRACHRGRCSSGRSGWWSASATSPSSPAASVVRRRCSTSPSERLHRHSIRPGQAPTPRPSGLRQPRRLSPSAVRLLTADDADRGGHSHRGEHSLSASAAAGETGPALSRVEHRAGSPPQVLHGHCQRRRSRRRAPLPVARTRLQHHETLEGRHTMSALTETYVDNVIGHLPENSRADIAAEIRATINDMVEDRLGEFDHPAEEQSAAAERQVLEELGDPIRLSREYTNSPQHLIGPAFYPLYIWSLRWVLPTVAV